MEIAGLGPAVDELYDLAKSVDQQSAAVAIDDRISAEDYGGVTGRRGK
jgi:hypothetical protein